MPASVQRAILHAAGACALAALVSCSPRLGPEGYLRVVVTWAADVTAPCVRVRLTTASGQVHQTDPLSRDGHSSFEVAVFQAADFGTNVQVDAVGFTDLASCATEMNPPERSAVWSGAFVSQTITTVNLELTVQHTNERPDGGLPTDAGLDAGFDAGADGGFIDFDHDGSPAGVDCDDRDEHRYPGAVEQCADGIDNDCNQLIDCADSACNGQPCAAQGTCQLGQCSGATSEVCTDGVDNDGDGFADCADSDCTNQLCNDGNGCTSGERCAGNVCSNGTPKDCALNLPACYLNAGCDAGVCLAAPAPDGTGTCSDGLYCTEQDSCDGDGGCAGTPRVCPTSPNTCLTPSCSEDGGCGFVVRTNASCDDSDPCTQSDQCQANGTCVGTTIHCDAPGECQTGGTCVGGSCTYTPRTGEACDGGTCNGIGQCAPSASFPYLPSNFKVSDLVGLTINDVSFECDTTINTKDTGGAVTVTSNCASFDVPSKVITQNQGPEAALLATGKFKVAANVKVTVVGDRPLIIAAIDSVEIASGSLVTTSAGSNQNCSSSSNSNAGDSSGGGAGGGFGTSSGAGGLWWWFSYGGYYQSSSGNAAIVPLRGGCSGGTGGGGTSGGAGGGTLQISTAKSLTIHGTLNAGGQPGRGGGNSRGGGGGGSGGALLLEANQLSSLSSAILVANGGSGGEGGSSNSIGHDGTPGTLTLDSASGGTGSCAGDGGRGGSRNGGAGDGADGPTGRCRGGTAGGGGGAVGRIRVNVVQGCSYSGATVSPQQTGSGSGC